MLQNDSVVAGVVQQRFDVEPSVGSVSSCVPGCWSKQLHALTFVERGTRERIL